MKISELTEQLEEILLEYGDLDVCLGGDFDALIEEIVLYKNLTGDDSPEDFWVGLS
jgi:hypothetical protein